MNRREFIEKACLSGIGFIAGTSILSSLDIPSLKASPRAGIFNGNREIPLRLEDTPELQKVGGAYHLEIEEIEKSVLVDTFTTVNIKCTHKGCDVKYDETGNKFVCPCHDSQFDINGIPKNGPANKPLGTYKTTLKDGEVIVYIPLEDESSEAVKDSTQVLKTDSLSIDTTKKK
jgi:cytochrome b6-f complex iron-sulfur subunit